MDIIDALPDFIAFLDKAHTRNIFVKKQNPKSQMEKEKFLKKVITYHYYNKFRKLCYNIDFQEIHKISYDIPSCISMDDFCYEA